MSKISQHKTVNVNKTNDAIETSNVSQNSHVPNNKQQSETSTKNVIIYKGKENFTEQIWETEY